MGIDSTLISLTEKVTHWVQKHFDRTNFWVARWIFVAGSLFAVPDCIDSLSSGDIVLASFTFLILFFIFSLSWIYFYILWERLEKDAFDRLKKGLLNPHKINSEAIATRISLLTLTLISLTMIAVDFYTIEEVEELQRTTILFLYWVIGFMFLTLGLYLIACDPLPPGSEKQKKKSLLAQLFKKQQPAIEGV